MSLRYPAQMPGRRALLPRLIGTVVVEVDCVTAARVTTLVVAVCSLTTAVGHCSLSIRRDTTSWECRAVTLLAAIISLRLASLGLPYAGASPLLRDRVLLRPHSTSRDDIFPTTDLCASLPGSLLFSTQRVSRRE